MRLRWILCDYGGVLADDHIQEHESKLASLFACDVTTLRQVTTERSPQGRSVRLDQVSEKQFWESVSDRITGSKLLPASEATLTEMWSNTYALRLDVLDVLNFYWRTGLKIGVATNVDQYRERYMRRTLNAAECKPTIFGSWKFKAMKPASEYFDAITDELGLSAFRSTIAFFDDQKVHTDAAQRAGWRAFPYHSPEAMRSNIASLLSDTIEG